MVDEAKITDLQIKLAFLERNLEELDGVVQGLGAQLEGLEKRLGRLQAEQESPADPL